jgi:hypothetical protein
LTPKISRKILRGETAPVVAVAGCDANIGSDILLQRLVEQGHLVEKKKDNPKDTDTDALTSEGVRLCTKKLIPRINRAKADQLVAELLQRAAEINRRGELTERVASIHVFGSYLTDSDSLGDINITIELERRHDDWDGHRTGQSRGMKSKWGPGSIMNTASVARTQATAATAIAMWNPENS